MFKNGLFLMVSFWYNIDLAKGESNCKRCVCPLKLVFKSREWYLQGFCLMREDYRTFKINRIIQPELLEDFFHGENFNPPAIEFKGTDSSSLIHKIKAVLRKANHI